MAHIPKYKLMGNTLYSLHRRPGSGYSVECNEFSLNVQPDYGGGITQEDAEAEAARIYAILNEYDQLKAENEALKERVKELESALEEIMRFELSMRHTMEGALQYPDNFLTALDVAKKIITK